MIKAAAVRPPPRFERRMTRLVTVVTAAEALQPRGSSCNGSGGGGDDDSDSSRGCQTAERVIDGNSVYTAAAAAKRALEV